MTLHLKNDDGELIWFIADVEDLTPEQIHVEVSTAIDRELEREREVHNRV